MSTNTSYKDVSAKGMNKAEQRRIDEEFIAELLKQGYSKSEISAICGKSSTWITARLPRSWYGIIN